MHDTGRARYDHVSDAEAVAAFGLLARTEGILPALESAHAIAWIARHAAGWSGDDVVVVNLSGRGDKDVQQVQEWKTRQGREAQP